MACFISNRFILNNTVKLCLVTRPSLLVKARQSHFITLKTLTDSNCFGKIQQQFLCSRNSSKPSSILNILRYATTAKTYELDEKKKPLVIFNSGDLEDSGLDRIPKSTLTPGFDKCQELQSADEMVKKIFSVDFAEHRIKVDTKLQEVIERVQMHKFDFSSPEVQIAKITVYVRNMQELMKKLRKFKKNSAMRVLLLHLIHRRIKLLNGLRAENFSKFQWLLDELKITYKTGYIPPQRLARREKLTIMVEDEAKSIREKKLQEYARALKALQPDFQRRKAQLLTQIADEEEILGKNLQDYMQENVDYIQSKAAVYRSSQNKTKQK